MCFPLHFDDGAVAIVTGEEGGVDCGRHEDDSEVRVHTNHVPKNHQNKVRLVGKGLKNKVCLVGKDLVREAKIRKGLNNSRAYVFFMWLSISF